jgi:outer membrane protein assembly factor BamB
MCSHSYDTKGDRLWCGAGWTGQPAVFEHNGRLLMAFGAYDRAIHLVDATTGVAVLPPFPTGDIVKGSLTVDPDGYPLVYAGSRDNMLRVLAFDGGAWRALWSLDADTVPGGRWNDDWDGAPLVVDDWLFEGGENSRIHAIRLNRGYDASGRVTAAPTLAWHAPGWDAELDAAMPDRNMSIEGSVTLLDDRLYFANSAGLVQGWDIRPLKTGGEPIRTLRYWTGDDTDATLVGSPEGRLYVAIERERFLARSEEVGQLIALDPTQPDAPRVWGLHDRPDKPLEQHNGKPRMGFWSTPALWRDLLIAGTDAGEVLGVRRSDGVVQWRLRVHAPNWSSPSVVDDTLVHADGAGKLRAWDLGSGTPVLRWEIDIGGNVEATPTLFNGSIWVATREGFMLRIADP